MSDTITKLVNDLGELRNAMYAERFAVQNKKNIVVNSNAMGLLKFMIDFHFKGDPQKEIVLHRQIQMLYDWLEYSYGLPEEMFIKMYEATKIWYNFRSLHLMYQEEDTQLTFSEWVAETEKKTDHAG